MFELVVVRRNTALVLQALRWQITRAPPGVQRALVLAAFAEHDVLGLRMSDGPLQALVSHESELVREYATRLLNCFASLSRGRSYLQTV